VSERTLERAVLLQDLLVVLLSLALAHAARAPLAVLLPGLKPVVPLSDSLHVLLVFVPTWFWCADRLHLFRVRTLAAPLIETLRALLWTQGWGALALSLILVVAQAPLNRSLIALFLAISTVLLLVAKFFQRVWIRGVRGQIVSLVLGADVEETVGELERLRGRRVERLAAPDALGLRERLHAGGVDEVVIPSPRSHEELRPLLEVCEEAGVPAFVRVERIDLDLARPRAEVIGPTLYLSYQTHEPDRPSLLAKLVFDRAAALLWLVALLPVAAAIALVVKLTSRGPVFFVQERGGLNGRSFPMLKFRTMREGAEAERAALLAANEMDGPVFKIANDPRVTPIGRLLRRTSLDELPQLVNVLLGHMSLVGPRPLPLVETRDLRGVHRRRLSVRPGITCLWQVSGRNDLRFSEWMALDLQYIDNWSLGLDFAILLRTIPALLSRRGAR
jgi:exopolysaccharide biosynthesis polyprenyl glycosylphosphotransferase